MKRFFMLMMVAICAFPAQAILVDAVNDSASKALAETLPCMGCGAGWDVEGGTRFGAGSCVLIRNNPTDGAWVLTARHTVMDSGGSVVREFHRYTFQPSYYDGFPKGSTGYSTTCTIAARRDKIFCYASQDLALVKLDQLVYNSSGMLVTPMEVSTTVTLAADQTILFGGSGDTGIPSQGGAGGTGYRDGFRRCARGVFIQFSAIPGKALMEFNRSVSLPGMASSGDSGGFVAIESSGRPTMCGIIITVSGSGETALTGFEYLGYTGTFATWMENTIANNRNNSAVSDWNQYE